MRRARNILWAALAAAPTSVFASPVATDSSTASADYESIDITGQALYAPRVGGAAHVIAKDLLERFEYDDIHRILTQVPGVYVRGEDGYGLRPNIGLRGVSSDRSSKITLMEDGVLFGPAPYSAPAAYFFPLTTRMVEVEVFKGATALPYGPQTVGGAINLVTRPVPPEGFAGELDVSVGSDRSGKVHGHWGYGGSWWGVLVEGVRLQSDGFKDLDGGGDTGFDKNEAMIKARVHSDPAADFVHEATVKLGYADESSRETYLGLTAADFAASALRRYAATQLAEMVWRRTQVQVDYTLQADQVDVQVSAYRHDFTRAWTKTNRLGGLSRPPPLQRILTNPVGQNAIYASILRGDIDTDDGQRVVLGTNDRSYVSQGIFTKVLWRPDWFSIDQEIELGARFHVDHIERDHTEESYEMLNRTLVRDTSPVDTVLQNRGEARAIAFHLQDRLQLGRFILTPGVRLELITSTLTNRATQASSRSTDFVALPGIVASWQALSNLEVLAGVHRGFSPVSPGQPDTVEPELSVNYEAGVRGSVGPVRGELIGFFNDYSNLLAECTENRGCGAAMVGEQVSGGAVDVYGLEASLNAELKLPLQLELRANVAYTLTRSRFRTSFRSGNAFFGSVQEGDELAYLPAHQATFNLGLLRGRWALDASVRHVAAMRDLPGQGPIPEDTGSDAHTILDVAARYAVWKASEVYVRADNLLDTKYVVARRPFGARPGKPLQIAVGYKHRFE